MSPTRLETSNAYASLRTILPLSHSGPHRVPISLWFTFLPVTKNVRMWTACCLAEAMRIYAPNAPFSNTELKVRSHAQRLQRAAHRIRSLSRILICVFNGKKVDYCIIFSRRAEQVRIVPLLSITSVFPATSPVRSRPKPHMSSSDGCFFFHFLFFFGKKR